MFKLGFQFFVCLAVVAGIFVSPLGAKINGVWYELQHRNDPTTAVNPPTDGFMGDQSFAECGVQPGFRACATAEVTYAVLGEGVNVEPHLNFTWNSAGNEANAVGSAWVHLSKSDGTITTPVMTGDNLLPFDHQYVPTGITATGFECVQRDAKTWDCR